MKNSELLQHQFDHDPLFAIAFHPTESYYIVGTASGIVAAHKYDPSALISRGVVEEPVSSWNTKRHKSSCRGLVFDYTGKYVYSIGSDNVIKKAKSESGKVVAKDKESLKSVPTTVTVNETFVATGDESSALTIFDCKNLEKTHRIESIHGDCITSIIPLAHRNDYHYLTSGSTTLAHIDLRKGIVSTSDDQEDELLSGCLASEKQSVFGLTEGVVTIWDNDHLEDQRNRIRLSDDSIDCVIAGAEDYEVYAGGADGIVRKLDTKACKVLKDVEWIHDRSEEVGMLELDYQYRLVTASMDKLKIWKKGDEIQSEEEDEKEKERPKKKSKKNKNGKTDTKSLYKNGISLFNDL